MAIGAKTTAAIRPMMNLAKKFRMRASSSGGTEFRAKNWHIIIDLNTVGDSPAGHATLSCE